MKLYVVRDKKAEKFSEMDNVSLQQMIDRIQKLRYRYLGSFPSDFFPFLHQDFNLQKYATQRYAG